MNSCPDIKAKTIIHYLKSLGKQLTESTCLT